MALPGAQLTKLQHEDPIINRIQDQTAKAINLLQDHVDSINTSLDGATVIGEVKSAFLTEAQFQAQAGTGWVLCDGRSVNGSKYQTLTSSQTIPDMRATVPRMKDNGKGLNPDGDLALGTYQADAYASHAHTFSTESPGGNVNAIPVHNSSGSSVLQYGTDNSGGNETRAKSTTINFFIRIN